MDIEGRLKGEDCVRAGETESVVPTSEHSLNLIINTIPELAWSSRADGFVEFVNQRWLDYAGFTPEQALGWSWAAALHPDDMSGLLEYWKGIMVTAQPGEYVARLRRFDGVCRWFLFRAVPLKDDSGNILKWYGQNVDIHERKEAEEKLRRSEAFLTEGQRLSRTGTFSWRTDTNAVTWSTELYRIFEIDQSIPATFELALTRVHPDDIPLFESVAARARETGADFETEHRLLMPDRSVKYLHVTALGSRDHEGRLEYIGVAQDVTQRRMSEDALARARAELANVARVSSLGVLTASIAHEVNQPLSGIITNVSN